MFELLYERTNSLFVYTQGQLCGGTTKSGHFLLQTQRRAGAVTIHVHSIEISKKKRFKDTTSVQTALYRSEHGFVPVRESTTKRGVWRKTRGMITCVDRIMTLLVENGPE